MLFYDVEHSISEFCKDSMGSSKANLLLVISNTGCLKNLL